MELVSERREGGGVEGGRSVGGREEWGRREEGVLSVGGWMAHLCLMYRCIHVHFVPVPVQSYYQ